MALELTERVSNPNSLVSGLGRSQMPLRVVTTPQDTSDLIDQRARSATIAEPAAIFDIHRTTVAAHRLSPP